MKFKGRPILGAVSGFFFGFWLFVVLISFAITDSGSILAIILPILGIVLGLGLAAVAPFGGGDPADRSA